MEEWLQSVKPKKKLIGIGGNIKSFLQASKKKEMTIKEFNKKVHEISLSATWDLCRHLHHLAPPTTIPHNFAIRRPAPYADPVPPGAASCYLQRSRQRRLSGPSDRPVVMTTIWSQRASRPDTLSSGAARHVVIRPPGQRPDDFKGLDSISFLSAGTINT